MCKFDLIVTLFVGVLCYALLCIRSSFAIILKRKRSCCFALLFYGCPVTVNVLGAVGWFAVCDCGIS